VELEQTFLRTARQTLALQANWRHERTSSNDRTFLAKVNSGTNQVYIDINEKMLDGTPNPYLLRPYMYGTQPVFRKISNDTEFYRATLAYQLDLSHEKNRLRWVGRHSFTGYAEYNSILSANFGYIDVVTSTEDWMLPIPANFNRTGAGFRLSNRYYVGAANGGRVEYAPQRAPEFTGSYTMRYYDTVRGWLNEPTDVGSMYSGSGAYIRRLLNTSGGVWQGSFLDGRIIPLLGLRQDISRSRQGNAAVAPSGATNGFYDQSTQSGWGQNDWIQRSGRTTNTGVVVKPLRWLRLAYSQSNSFQPGSVAYDVYWQPLPDPRGKTKDYGFDLDLFRDATGRPRINIRARQYETIDSGRSTGEVPAIITRTIQLDYIPGNVNGEPQTTTFLRNELLTVNPNMSSAEQDATIIRLIGRDPHFNQAAVSRAGADDAVSRGKEIELAYNPSNAWTVKATVTQTRAFNGHVSQALQDYIQERLAVWTTLKSPFDGSPYWNGSFKLGGLTPEQYYNTNILGPLKLALASEGKPRTQTREWRANLVTNYKLAQITENPWLKRLNVGGAVRWEARGSIGFYGMPPDSDGIIRSLDPNKPVWDKARYYFDFMAGYDLRLFQDKIRARLQLNVRNVFEDGRLQPIAVNPDGTPWAFRIIDPRQFILSATFSL
jgi:hypothetical protein